MLHDLGQVLGADRRPDPGDHRAGAANVGVAAADHRYAGAAGAGLQLVVNLSTIVLAGTAPLFVQRRLTTWAGRRGAGALEGSATWHSSCASDHLES